MNLSENNKKVILKNIRNIPDFPRKGILFKDITPLLKNPEAYQILMNHLEERYRDKDLDYIAGIESRGFIFGSALADRLKVGFVPIRKKGKLPYTTVAEKYELEYRFDEIEVHIDAFESENNSKKARVLLIDDLLATGGTASAGVRLIKKLNAECVEACFVLELGFLNGRDKIDAPVYSVIDLTD